MISSNKTFGFNLFALMTTLFALSIVQTSGFDSNLFGGRRNQFLCFGENVDIIKLNDGEAKRPTVLGANLYRRYSFTVASSSNMAECTTTGGDRGDVDLYICENPEAGACMENPHDSSTESGTSETVSTVIGAQTWYVIVKAGLEPATYTIRCDEKFPAPIV